MSDTFQNRYFPLSPEDHALIRRIATYAVNNRYQSQLNVSPLHEHQDRNFAIRALVSDLRQMLKLPDETSAKKVSKLFYDINNMDRMILLKMRPTLIRSCHDLEFILREAIPLHDRLLFACAQIHLIYDPDDDRCMDNLISIMKLIPWKQIEKFHSFAVKMIASQHEKYLQEQARLNTSTSQHTDVYRAKADTSPAEDVQKVEAASTSLPAHAYSFTAGFILAAANIAGHVYGKSSAFNLATMLAAAGSFAHGCYDLFQQQPVRKELASIVNQVSTMWHRTKYHPLPPIKTHAPRL